MYFMFLRRFLNLPTYLKAAPNNFRHDRVSSGTGKNNSLSGCPNLQRKKYTGPEAMSAENIINHT